MSWREEIINRINIQAQEKIMKFARYISNVEKLREVARKVVLASDLEIKLLSIDPYDLSINIYEGNNKLVHHLAQALKLRFEKVFSESYGEMTYKAKLDGVNLNIFEVKDIPKCRIIPRKIRRTVTETRYQIICK